MTDIINSNKQTFSKKDNSIKLPTSSHCLMPNRWNNYLQARSILIMTSNEERYSKWSGLPKRREMVHVTIYTWWSTVTKTLPFSILYKSKGLSLYWHSYWTSLSEKHLKWGIRRLIINYKCCTLIQWLMQ